MLSFVKPTVLPSFWISHTVHHHNFGLSRVPGNSTQLNEL